MSPPPLVSALALAGQIIEISRVGPGTTQRERGAERLTVMREMMAEVSLDPGRVMSSIVLTQAEIIHTNITMLS